MSSPIAIDDQPEYGLPAEDVFAALLAELAPAATAPKPQIASAAAVTAAAPGAPTVAVPPNAVLLKGPPLKLAQNMDASLAIPTATTFRELAVGTLESQRSALNAALKSAGRSEKLSFTHLIAWALVQAAKQFPVMGTSVLKSGNDTYRIPAEHINLGLAVDVERKDGSRGLMVPVLKQAGTMDFAQFLAAYEALVDKARHNKLMPDDFAGANMTLTNPGGLGTVASVPRLMPGQGTIFATGSIAYPPEFTSMDPAAIKQLGISKVMMITSTYDHRVIQGAESGSFLRVVDQLLHGDAGFYGTISTSLGVTVSPAQPGERPSQSTQEFARTPTPAVTVSPAQPGERPSQGTQELARTPNHAVTVSPAQPGERPSALTQDVASRSIAGNATSGASEQGPSRPAGAQGDAAGGIAPLYTAGSRRGEVPLAAIASAMGLVKAFRTHGHLAAQLDPLGTPPAGDPSLDPAYNKLTPDIMSRIPADILDIGVPGDTLADALPYLQRTYCGTIAYEVEHLASHERRTWLHHQIESGVYRTALTPNEQRAVLARLTQVEGLETFLQKAYLGAKRFSIEGVDIMVPMIDVAIDLAASAGVRQVVLGMAHRGRLNVLAHTVGFSYETILAEFEGGAVAEAGTIPEGGTGDVKYHLGARGRTSTSHGEIDVTLLPNPSHLEFVGAVVVGHARADQMQRTAAGIASQDLAAAMPITIHGDAAFPGQGVVPETLNLSGLPGYRTGGTLHIIANNQVGFTTDPTDARSTRYSSDLAKGFDIPIIHVNADDPDACVAAVRLAIAYRMQFQSDVLIDLIGYRRHGHNETDEPAYTQPTMYSGIRTRPTVRKLYADALAHAGSVTSEEADAMAEHTYNRFVEIQTAFKASIANGHAATPTTLPVAVTSEVSTAVDAGQLHALNDQLLRTPQGFTVHPKLVKQLERRRTGIDARGGIDWAHAEALAFASLLIDGSPIRLTGQDVGRGTFSQRHMVLHDAQNGTEYAPVQHLDGARATLEVHNSPLSELACIGFEYGYAVAAPEALVCWEAQYGDFVNGAQVMIDQFISSSLSKWGETSRLTLLLPHGFEGSGPEHSSARLERMLQLAAEGNIRVANCSTPAQYFHLLRRQAKWDLLRPLVIFTPKALLRLAAAGSSLDDLANGSFQPVLDDPVDLRGSDRVILCSGKIYYDLLKGAGEGGRRAIARLEQFYPFPDEQLQQVFARYPSLREVIWAQEEPRNMGGWSFAAPRLRALLPPNVALRYVGRPGRASPAEGYESSHKTEQARIIAEALGRA